MGYLFFELMGAMMCLIAITIYSVQNNSIDDEYEA